MSRSTSTLLTGYLISEGKFAPSPIYLCFRHEFFHSIIIPLPVPSSPWSLFPTNTLLSSPVSPFFRLFPLTSNTHLCLQLNSLWRGSCVPCADSSAFCSVKPMFGVEGQWEREKKQWVSIAAVMFCLGQNDILMSSQNSITSYILLRTVLAQRKQCKVWDENHRREDKSKT